VFPPPWAPKVFPPPRAVPCLPRRPSRTGRRGGAAWFFEYHYPPIYAFRDVFKVLGTDIAYPRGVIMGHFGRSGPHILPRGAASSRPQALLSPFPGHALSWVPFLVDHGRGLPKVFPPPRALPCLPRRPSRTGRRGGAAWFFEYHHPPIYAFRDVFKVPGTDIAYPRGVIMGHFGRSGAHILPRGAASRRPQALLSPFPGHALSWVPFLVDHGRGLPKVFPPPRALPCLRRRPSRTGRRGGAAWFFEYHHPPIYAFRDVFKVPGTDIAYPRGVIMAHLGVAVPTFGLGALQAAAQGPPRPPTPPYICF
jgi:hypothetical protein